ncbi:MAG TPA: PilZ domain-containing protein, partial [Nitrospiraceae bacterium]|nr:PilZ domain-containing protein [Nitrospiraceae bacterium]
AVELPEWRKTYRIRHRLPCELVAGEERLTGAVEDINETGALIRVNKQVLEGNDRLLVDRLLVSINTPAGDWLAVEGRICRQEQVSSSEVEIGLKFIDVDEKTADSLIVAAFSDSRAWNQPEVEPGIFRSLWSLLRVFVQVVRTPRTSLRRDLRLPYRENCLLVLPDRTLEGRVEQISATGLSVNIPGTVELVGENGTLYVESFSLKVRRRWVTQSEGVVLAGFTIEQIDEGADQWRELTSLAA